MAAPRLGRPAPVVIVGSRRARANVFVATSLDGFIAREDGGIDWLPAGGEEDHGYAAFFASMDALVVGRNTWDLVRTFGTWPYGDKPVVVLTRRPVVVPRELERTVRIDSGEPREIAQRLAARGLRELYVDGGRVVQGFLAAGLVRRIVLTRVPVLLGRGIPLFGPLAGDVVLRHVATRSYANGLVQSEYEVPTGT